MKKENKLHLLAVILIILILIYPIYFFFKTINENQNKNIYNKNENTYIENINKTSISQSPLVTKNISNLCPNIFIPAYFYPGNLWDTTIKSYRNGMTLIMDPDNGPGKIIDNNYVKSVASAQNAGIKIIGYIDTSYAKRSIETIKKEIDLYYLWYKVDGIFIDQVPSQSSSLNYIKEIFDYVKLNKKNYVTLNPGVVPDESYMNISDNIVIFEGSISSYLKTTFPDWLTKYTNHKFTNLIYDVQNSFDMKTLLQKAVNKNIGNIFITNDVMLNPWDTLPKYWNDELIQIDSYCNFK